MSELTRIDAIRIIENITDKDDPAWEWAVEEFYDEESDAMPTIYDVLSVLGVSESEYKEATGAQNTNWPEVELDYAVEKETEIDKLQAQLSQLQAENERLTKDLKQKELIHIGYTNKYQIAYAKEEEGSFYPDTDNECYIPVYMLKVHSHRAKIMEEALATEEGEKS